MSEAAPIDDARSAPAAAAPTPVLEARALFKRYGGVVAVDGLDLRVGPAEVYCLLGPNGAGKTTTIHLFLGFIEPTAGSVHVTGLDVAAEPLESKRRLAYVPEQVMLYRNLSGLENLEYFAALGGRGSLDPARLGDVLVGAGLPRDAVHRRVSEYSKGMRQKVGIAVAMAKEADALLLDEPTSGLDPQASREFSELLGRLRDHGVAVLMATHDLFRAKETGTRVGIMRHGRLVTELSTDEIGHADLERIYLEHMHE